MKFINLFAVIIILLVFAFFGMVVLKINSVGQAAHDVMLILIGSLAGALSTVIGYYFGSSNSSSEKNDTIKEFVGQPKDG